MGQLPTFLTTREVAQVLRKSPGTIENWRYTQSGPAYVKINGAIRYTPEAIRDYLDAKTEQFAA